MIDYNWDNEEGLQLFMRQKYKNENLKCNGSPAKVLYNVEGWSDLNGRVLLDARNKQNMKTKIQKR